jgi:hypothetical protein
MSNDIDFQTSISDATIALFLEERGADELTDALVEALQDALRIMVEEISGSVH